MARLLLIKLLFWKLLFSNEPTKNSLPLLFSISDEFILRMARFCKMIEIAVTTLLLHGTPKHYTENTTISTHMNFFWARLSRTFFPFVSAEFAGLVFLWPFIKDWRHHVDGLWRIQEITCKCCSFVAIFREISMAWHIFKVSSKSKSLYQSNFSRTLPLRTYKVVFH